MMPSRSREMFPVGFRMFSAIFIECINQHYTPACSPEEATHTMATEEIRTAIISARPDVALESRDIPPLMESAGYRLGIPVGSVECAFRWLLRRK